MSSKVLRMLTHLVCFTAFLMLLTPGVSLAQATYTCQISTSGGSTCDNWNISVANTGGNTRTAVINLNASFAWKYLVVRVRSCNAWGWSFHLGDSVSNNGGGGDARDAQHDAELQAYYSTVTVFASDYYSGLNVTAGGPPSSGCATQEYRIYNHYVWVDPDTSFGGNESAWLHYFFDFPFNGRYDETDSEDVDLSELNKIYLGLNRTYADPFRNGGGAVEACVYLSTVENTPVSNCTF